MKAELGKRSAEPGSFLTRNRHTVQVTFPRGEGPRDIATRPSRGGLNLDDFRAYRAETDPRKKRRLMDKLVRDNDRLTVSLVSKLGRSIAKQLPEGLDVGNVQVRPGKRWEETIQSDIPGLEDLLQAGRIGMCKALEKFDPSKASFSTYAAHWIRHEVQQAALRLTTVYRPKGSGIPFEMLKRVEEIRWREGRDPMAAELGVTEKRLADWLGEAQVVQSLDDIPEDLEGEQTIHSIHADPAELASEVLEEWGATAEVRELVDMLPPAERDVIRGLYLDGNTTPRVATTLGLSQDRVLELRDRALARMRKEFSA